MYKNLLPAYPAPKYINGLTREGSEIESPCI